MQTGGQRAADLGFVLLIPTQPYPNKSPRVKLFSNIKSDVTTGCPTQHKTTMAINVTALITFFNGPAPNKERNGNPIPLQVLLHLSPLFSLLIFGSDRSSRSDAITSKLSRAPYLHISNSNRAIFQRVPTVENYHYHYH